jgi:imidazolonepropionase-like amidohydrolase
MTLRFPAAVLLIALWPGSLPAQGQVLPPSVALTHVSVLDVRTGSVRSDQTVIVTGTRIAAVDQAGRVAVPAGALIVDATGKYLMPGLWDMHTHIIDPDTPGTPDVVFPLLVANGVTGVRDMGSADLDSIIAIRSALRAGARLGPRMLLAGKALDGLPAIFPPDEILVRTPAEGRRAVDSLAARGVDFIKPYEMLQRDVFLAIVDAAKQHRLPLAAHVPLALDAGEASDLGVRSFEHLRNIELACSSLADSLRTARVLVLAREASRPDTTGLAFGWSLGYGPGALVRAQIHREQRPRARETFHAARCDALLRRLARNGTWQDATLVADDVARLDTMATVRATLRYVPEATRALWERTVAGWDATGTHGAGRGRADIEAQAAWYLKLVGLMAKRGVGILAGTDISNPYLIPGFSLHEELGQLVRTGLTPLEAIRAATLNPARYLAATDSLGTVEVGRLADLVLLDADPFQDIGNTRKIRAVMLNGRYLDRGALDGLLADAERAASTRPR